MSNKFIVGDFPDKTSINVTPNNLELSWGWGSGSKVDLVKFLKTAEIMTEENKSSFIGKVGWGAVGGLTLGLSGLAAGALAGGNSKELTVACELVDGRKFISVVDSDVYQRMLKVTFKNKDKTTEDVQREIESYVPVYKRPLTMWITLIFFFPAGLFILWKYTPYKMRTKVIITSIWLLFAIVSQVNKK